MSYIPRTSSRRWPHDPASHGIFIHGGTCLMHGRRDPFSSSARPNSFSLTIPSVDGERPKEIPWDQPYFTTFAQAVAYAEALRESHPILHHCPIYACTDLIHEHPWVGKTKVQLVSHRLSKRASASMPARQAA